MFRYFYTKSDRKQKMCINFKRHRLIFLFKNKKTFFVWHLVKKNMFGILKLILTNTTKIFELITSKSIQ